MMDNLRIPRKLKRGDRVAVVSLSWGGPGAFPHRYEAGVRQLEEAFGVQVVPMPNALRDAEWLARNPEARADDLTRAFGDPSIRGIISTIGGEDSIRLLPHLDLDLMHDNPKVLMGFSDTTVTHFVCLKAGLRSYYGPAMMAGFAENGGIFEYMRASVERTLFSSEAIGLLTPNSAGWTVEHLDWADPANQARKRKLQPATGWRFLQGSGTHSGRLIGGCIEVLDWLRGTGVWPAVDVWEGAVLFLETSEEAPPPIAVKRILRTLGAVGVLGAINGVLFGRPGGQAAPEKFGEYDSALMDVIAKESERKDIPIVTNMDFGHTDPMMVLPYGALCEIDCDARQVTIPESGVK